MTKEALGRKQFSNRTQAWDGSGTGKRKGIYSNSWLYITANLLTDRLLEFMKPLFSTTYSRIFLSRRWTQKTWCRHQMETFSGLLAICAGNSPVPDEFPTQRLETRSFDVFFDMRLNKPLSKQSWGWWFETLSPHYDVIVMKFCLMLYIIKKKRT